MKCSLGVIEGHVDIRPFQGKCHFEALWLFQPLCAPFENAECRLIISNNYDAALEIGTSLLVLANNPTIKVS